MTNLHEYTEKKMEEFDAEFGYLNEDPSGTFSQVEKFITQTIRETALEAYKALWLEGMKIDEEILKEKKSKITTEEWSNLGRNHVLSSISAKQKEFMGGGNKMKEYSTEGLLELLPPKSLIETNTKLGRWFRRSALCVRRTDTGWSVSYENPDTKISSKRFYDVVLREALIQMVSYLKKNGLII